MYTQGTSQETAPAPKPKRWPRRVAIGAAVAVAFGVGIGIGGAGHSTTTKTVAVRVPGPTVTQTVPGPTVTQTVSPPPPAAGSTLLNQTGSGTEQTKPFTVGGNGDYTVSWTFSGNDQSGDGGDNFIVNETTVGNGDDVNADGLPNVIQTSGSGNTGVSDDPGVHTFNVQADQGSTWTLKVVSAP